MVCRVYAVSFDTDRALHEVVYNGESEHYLYNLVVRIWRMIPYLYYDYITL